DDNLKSYLSPHRSWTVCNASLSPLVAESHAANMTTAKLNPQNFPIKPTWRLLSNVRSISHRPPPPARFQVHYQRYPCPQMPMQFARVCAPEGSKARAL